LCAARFRQSPDQREGGETEDRSRCARLGSGRALTNGRGARQKTAYIVRGSVRAEETAHDVRGSVRAEETAQLHYRIVSERPSEWTQYILPRGAKVSLTDLPNALIVRSSDFPWLKSTVRTSAL